MGGRGRELAGRPASPLGSQVLRAKLRAPTAPEHFVRRARLHRLLDEVATAPVTLVVAPAGAGKTSLLSGWTAESATPTCWLTLDETDRGAAQLWSGVIEALATRILGCGEQARALLQHPGSVLAGIDNLLEDLDLLLTSSTVLVLDDVHLIDDDEAVNSSLAYFVQHVPPLLHVVLASRRVPRLPLDRLRARGSVGEVQFAQLRLSLAEAAEMLTRLAPAMSEEEVSTAAAHAEGWAAGVQLAALAARSARALDEPNPASAGTDLLIHDYVWHEVLAREDPDLVQVLSDTAVVERIDPSLAHALTGRADAGDLLIRAEARGLFVSRLGPEGWFEVHSLVRAALLGEQARSGRAAPLNSTPEQPGGSRWPARWRCRSSTGCSLESLAARSGFWPPGTARSTTPVGRRSSGTQSPPSPLRRPPPTSNR